MAIRWLVNPSITSGCRGEDDNHVRLGATAKLSRLFVFPKQISTRRETKPSLKIIVNRRAQSFRFEESDHFRLVWSREAEPAPSDAQMLIKSLGILAVWGLLMSAFVVTHIANSSLYLPISLQIT